MAITRLTAPFPDTHSNVIPETYWQVRRTWDRQMQRAVDQLLAGGGLALLQVEVNLGTAPRKNGSFTISGAGMTVGKPVLIQQAAAVLTGKGTRADENEMDGIMVVGQVTSATVIRCYWSTPSFVRGNFKFNYQVSA